jgi:hypothetical protein
LIHNPDAADARIIFLSSQIALTASTTLTRRQAAKPVSINLTLGPCAPSVWEITTFDHSVRNAKTDMTSRLVAKRVWVISHWRASAQIVCLDLITILMTKAITDLVVVVCLVMIQTQSAHPASIISTSTPIAQSVWMDGLGLSATDNNKNLLIRFQCWKINAHFCWVHFVTHL